MDNEFDIYHADHEESQQIIDWAIGTGAAIAIMLNLIDQEYPSEQERIEDVKETIEMILNNLPEVMINPIRAAAGNAILEAREEDAAVAKFREELDEL